MKINKFSILLVLFLIFQFFLFSENNNQTVEIPININTLYQEEKLFGKSIVIFEDILLISSPWEFVKGIEKAGAVYIYKKNDTGWQELKKITAHDLTPYSLFGTSVQINEKFIFIGSTGGNYLSGKVYIYNKDETLGFDPVYPVQILTSPDNQIKDGFGGGLAINGNTLVVSAETDNQFSGMVYVYNYNIDTKTWDNPVTLSINQEGAFFGRSIIIKNDKLLIGAPGSNNKIGGAYLFTRIKDNKWELTQEFFDMSGRLYDEFGSSVALNDGLLVIGAQGYDRDNIKNTGSVYIYKLEKQIENDKEKEIWKLKTHYLPQVINETTETGKTISDSFVQYQSFGSSLAITDNVIFAGAPGDQIVNKDTGSVIFGSISKIELQENEWVLNNKIFNNEITSMSNFGNTFVLAGKEIFIGAYGLDEVNIKNKGAAFIYNFTN